MIKTLSDEAKWRRRLSLFLFAAQLLFSIIIVLGVWADHTYWGITEYDPIQVPYSIVGFLSFVVLWHYIQPHMKRWWGMRHREHRNSDSVQRVDYRVHEADRDIVRLGIFPLMTLVTAFILPSELVSSLRETLLGVIIVTQSIEVWKACTSSKRD